MQNAECKMENEERLRVVRNAECRMQNEKQSPTEAQTVGRGLAPAAN